MKPSQLINGIDTVILRVSDVKRSKNWYVEKLGFEVMFEDDNIKLVVMDTKGPTSLTLWETTATLKPHKETSAYPILKTDNAEQLRALLMNLGINTDEIYQDDYVKSFNFYDIDGNILEACQVLE